MFWVIEAKSPKSIDHPFDYSYVTQGLQYCIHPEIQAKYMVFSNGIYTSVYDAYSSVFFESCMYDPVFEFKNTEILDKWDEIYGRLSVESIRDKVEEFLSTQYKKLCLSSLDERYPRKLSAKITSENGKLEEQIRKNVARLNVEYMDKGYKEWQEDLKAGPLRYLKICMEYPIRRGKEPSQHYVEWRLKEVESTTILSSLIDDYETSCYFKKEHIFIALCHLHNLSDEDALREEIKDFVKSNMSKPISPLNKAESALIRIIRKIIVIYAYPKLRGEISAKLSYLSELARFVGTPTSQDYTYVNELKLHEKYFALLKVLSEDKLVELIPTLLEYEALLEENFKIAKNKIPQGEREINGFEWYGSGDVIYTLKNIALNYGVISKEEHAAA